MPLTEENIAAIKAELTSAYGDTIDPVALRRNCLKLLAEREELLREIASLKTEIANDDMGSG